VIILGNLMAIMHTFLNRFAIVSIFALALSITAFCGEIHDAAKAGDLAKVKTLLKENPEKLVFSKDDFDNMPLHLAAQEGHKDVAELLPANKADINAKNKSGNTPLRLAVVAVHKDVVELLLNKGADVNSKNIWGSTILSTAFYMNQTDTVKLLLIKGADVNSKDIQSSTYLQ